MDRYRYVHSFDVNQSQITNQRLFVEYKNSIMFSLQDRNELISDGRRRCWNVDCWSSHKFLTLIRAETKNYLLNSLGDARDRFHSNVKLNLNMYEKCKQLAGGELITLFIHSVYLIRPTYVVHFFLWIRTWYNQQTSEWGQWEISEWN